MAMTEDRVLERVRLLLARAEHPNTPAPEAELALDQANKLMVRHAIDEAIIRSHQSAEERRKPTSRKISLGESGLGEFWPMLRTILTEVANANRCSAVLGVGGGYSNEVFGFDEDVAWVDMLYTSIYFDFIRKINPKWDPAKEYDENVYNFKVAGHKWYDINRMAMEHGNPDMRRDKKVDKWDSVERRFNTILVPDDKMYKSGIVNAYKRHAKKVGDNNLVATTSFDEYRRQFSEAYETTVCSRLRRQAREATETAEETTGGVVAIRDVKEAVNEALWAAYPQFSPESRQKEMEKSEARAEQRRKEREEMLANMTPTQRYDFLEKEQRKARAQARRNQRYWDTRPRSNSSAEALGRKAGEAVDISRKGGSVRHNTRKEIS